MSSVALTALVVVTSYKQLGEMAGIDRPDSTMTDPGTSETQRRA